MARRGIWGLSSSDSGVGEIARPDRDGVAPTTTDARLGPSRTRNHVKPRYQYRRPVCLPRRGTIRKGRTIVASRIAAAGDVGGLGRGSNGLMRRPLQGLIEGAATGARAGQGYSSSS